MQLALLTTQRFVEALRNDKEKKHKGKHLESKSTLEETRNSLRVKLNQMVESREAQPGVIDKTSAKPLVKAKTGTQFLIDQFPYSSLSDLELVKLFDVSGFKLGETMEESLHIVHSLRALSKDCFVSNFDAYVSSGNINVLCDIPTDGSNVPVSHHGI